MCLFLNIPDTSDRNRRKGEKSHLLPSRHTCQQTFKECHGWLLISNTTLTAAAGKKACSSTAVSSFSPREEKSVIPPSKCDKDATPQGEEEMKETSALPPRYLRSFSLTLFLGNSPEFSIVHREWVTSRNMSSFAESTSTSFSPCQWEDWSRFRSTSRSQDFRLSPFSQVNLNEHYDRLQADEQEEPVENIRISMLDSSTRDPKRMTIKSPYKLMTETEFLVKTSAEIRQDFRKIPNPPAKDSHAAK